MQLGRTPKPTIAWEAGKADLFTMALGWLREDRALRREKEAAAGRMRGPRDEVGYSVGRDLTHQFAYKDAKTFFEKYDYGH